MTLHTLALGLPLLIGCGAATSRTIVEKRVEPRHFKFVTVVPKRGVGPGGWRAACLHLRLARDSGESFICKFGIEMPLETQAEGPISTALAQRVSADCSNLAADAVFSAVTPATPLGLACESYKSTYKAILYKAIQGAQVKQLCHSRTEPIVFPP